MGITRPDQPNNEIHDSPLYSTRSADCCNKDFGSPGDRNVNLSWHMRSPSLMTPSVSSLPQKETNFTSVVSIQPEGATENSPNTPQEATHTDVSAYMPGMHYERAASSITSREPTLASGLRTVDKGAKAASTYLRPNSAAVDDDITSLPATAHSTRNTPSEYRVQGQGFAVPSIDDPISPLPVVTLRRASHIYHKKRPPSCRASRVSLPPIITDLPRPESRQSIQPPLSAPSSVNSSSIHLPNTPSDSPGEGEDSPCSVYSTKSLRRTSIYVQWDNTGYLAGEHSDDVWDEPSRNLTTRDDLDGNSLKRQYTSVIKDLLRQRRRRAGLE